MSGLGPTATSGHVKQRQRQRRHLHDSHCGLICGRVSQKKFAETGLLVSSNAKPTAWPGLILSGFVWPDPVCGLSNYGLSDAWPDLVRSGLTWSNLVWYEPVLGLSSYGLSDT